MNFTPKPLTDINSTWTLFGDLLPKVFPDVIDEYDLYETLKNWYCFVIHNDTTPCALAFFSRTGGSIKMFHPCVIPTYLRHVEEMFKMCIHKVADLMHTTYILTQAQVGDDNANALIVRCGFNLCGTIPLDWNGSIIDINIYKLGVQNG